MSHIVSIQTEVRDATAVCAACSRLQLPAPREGVTRLFSGQVRGLAVQLPCWKYSVVCETSTGKVHCDTFEGRWGDPRELDRLLQAYPVEKDALESRRRGYSVAEQTLTDGSIKLTIQRVFANYYQSENPLTGHGRSGIAALLTTATGFSDEF